MLVYMYQADLYCQRCGEAIREGITQEGVPPVNSDNEFCYDSDHYPKGPCPVGGGEADCPQHCGAGPGCLSAIELSDGTKVGAWLENDLTAEGVEYVREVVQENEDSEVVELWAEFYRDSL